MWLNWLDVIPQSERSLVRFQVRTHAWVVGSVPSQGTYERQQTNVSHIDVSLPLSPVPLLSLKKKNQKACLWVRIKKKYNIKYNTVQ